MSDMDAYREIFITESAEFMQGITDGLLALEHNPADAEPVEVIFRGAHSLKGMSAAMGYDLTADLTHRMESLVDRVRRHERPVTPDLIDLMLDAVDLVKALIEVESSGAGSIDTTEVVSRLSAMAEAPVPTEGDPGQHAGTGSSPAMSDETGLRVDVTLSSDCVLKAVRAYMVIKRLGHVGEVVDTVPAARDIEDEHFDLTFSVLMRTEATAEELRSAVLGVTEVESVEIAEELLPLPEHTGPEAGSDAASAPASRHAVPKLSETQTVRIAIGHLDTLVDLVGELVILRSRLERASQILDSRELTEVTEEFGRVSTELQHEVMQARMVPVGNVFNRFPRMVRDLARSLGKEVAFEMEGLEIELDRTVLDEIGDPLVHLLRNGIDHGIESPDARLAAGKPRHGTVRLEATRERESVRLTVADDGAGIDVERVWRKACEAGIVDADSRGSMRDDDVLLLTCVPGFTTTDEATAVSGRGVGMDAVKGKIEYLGGTLQIHTEPGRGTEVVLQLPLTLAIIQALMIRTSSQVFAVPLGSVEEVLAPSDTRLETVDGAPVLVPPEGCVVPVFRLDALLGTRDISRPQGPAEDEHLLTLVDGAGQRKALVVDELLGRQEIVVKPLSGPLRDVRGLSGATVLGDGSVALIIDPRTVFPSREEVVGGPA